MKIVYSCPLPFNITGPGIPQGAIKRGLDKHSRDMGGEHEVYIINGENFPYDHKSLYHGILFDSYACWLEQMQCDIFLGVGCASLDQMFHVHQNGGKVVTSWFSSHYKYAQHILGIEYPKHGITAPPIDELLIFRAEKEQAMSDTLIVPSEWCASTYRAHHPDKVKVVPFGVDNKKFHLSTDPTVNLTFTVLYAGGNTIRKGLSDLLIAWNNLQYKDGMLTILGAQGPNQFWRTRILGWIADEKVPEVYRKNKIFCLPSLEEGSALVCLEAMASGLPLVVTYESGAQIEDGREGLIVPKQDPKKLGEAIAYFHENPSEIQRMGQNARKKAEELTWERFGQGVYEVLEEVGKK